MDPNHSSIQGKGMQTVVQTLLRIVEEDE
eukprot:COSAG01_NODE_58614_length_305_cov_0.650485_1_plen_28_part_10